jgi:hypothetical protein
MRTRFPVWANVSAWRLTPWVSAWAAPPQQFPVIYKNVRRALLRRFPYALMFVIEADETLTVIACFHGSRDPEHWQKRA